MASSIRLGPLTQTLALCAGVLAPAFGLDACKNDDATPPAGGQSGAPSGGHGGGSARAGTGGRAGAATGGTSAEAGSTSLGAGGTNGGGTGGNGANGGRGGTRASGTGGGVVVPAGGEAGEAGQAGRGEAGNAGASGASGGQAGEGSTASDCPADPQTGGLRVVLTRAPHGGDVTITGPTDFSQHLTASTLLCGLEPTLFHLRSLDVAPGLPGDDVFIDKANPARAETWVTAGETATVTIDYGEQGLSLTPQAGLPSGMWFALGSTLAGLRFGLPDGDYNADVVTQIQADPDGFSEADALAFDGLGGLWLSDYQHEIVRRQAGGASVTGNLGDFDVSTLNTPFHPNRLAFDADHTLWITGPDVANQNVIALLGLPEAAVEDPTNARTSSSMSDFQGFEDPDVTAFDPRGLFWVSLPETQAVAPATAQLDSGGAVPLSPMQIPPFTSPAPFTPEISGMVFDAAGIFWIADGPLNEVVGYSVAQQTEYTRLPAPAYRVQVPPVPQEEGDARLRLAIEPCTGELVVFSPTRGLFRFDVSTPDSPSLVATITSPDIAALGAQYFFDMAMNPIPPGMPLAGGSCSEARVKR
ncbi:MAG TPA: hypothetical protein VMI54_14210 [Polyangiaceae bacterium]|nr:hypothetical protein [Polyangiaceae bacterium]